MNQIKIKSSLLLACGLAFVALPRAHAEYNSEHQADAMFKAADVNNDGKLTRTKHASHGKAMFTDMDTNRDGMVTLAEMTVAHAKMNTDRKMMKMHDTNQDGQMSAAEHAAGCNAMFTKMDTNNDGTVSKDECKQDHKMMQSEE